MPVPSSRLYVYARIVMFRRQYHGIGSQSSIGSLDARRRRLSDARVRLPVIQPAPLPHVRIFLTNNLRNVHVITVIRLLNDRSSPGGMTLVQISQPRPIYRFELEVRAVRPLRPRIAFALPLRRAHPAQRTFQVGSTRPLLGDPRGQLTLPPVATLAIARIVVILTHSLKLILRTSHSHDAHPAVIASILRGRIWIPHATRAAFVAHGVFRFGSGFVVGAVGSVAGRFVTAFGAYVEAHCSAFGTAYVSVSRFVIVTFEFVFGVEAGVPPFSDFWSFLFEHFLLFLLLFLFLRHKCVSNDLRYRHFCRLL
mmetsp:Transcript_5596/g.12127  ORF Transcript_5596/g.12127 Transcript_5596/m.12127 type:complete len:310 (-) Transcript_5596:424-1353(-)